jgi:hypothetical protein
MDKNFFSRGTGFVFHPEVQPARSANAWKGMEGFDEQERNGEKIS